MDGDFGNLKELIAVAKSHDASVFVDEAHSMLGCGENGRGAAEKFDVEDQISLVYGTFSKTFGALGGFVGDGSIPALLRSSLRLFLCAPARGCRRDHQSTRNWNKPT
jgi:7-keto-8-aminopelargonate synthetase-like enzyme